MTIEIIPSPAPALRPAPLFTPTPKAARRVLEFFTAQVNNDHTRKAYLNATRHFAAWCDEKGIHQLDDVQAFHVDAFVKELQSEFSAPTVKQHLAALRMLFDWLVTGHVLDVNLARAVRGPKYVVKKGKTPVLTADEARELLHSIAIARNTTLDSSAETDEPALIVLRDRALIGVIVYTFARINAVLQMKVRDYFVQGRRGMGPAARKRWQGTRGPLSPQSGGVPRRIHRRRWHRRRSRGPFVSGADRQAHRQGHVAAGCLPHDPETDARHRHQDQDREPYLPGDRHYRLPEEQRRAGSRAAHRQPREPSDDETLRQATG